MSWKTLFFVARGMILNICFTWLIHKIAMIKIENQKISKIITMHRYIKCKYIRYKRNNEKYGSEKLYRLLIGVGYLIFTDILFADYYKMKLGTDKKKKKKYISRMNFVNLIVSLVFIILSFTNINLVLFSIVCPFIFVRALSRSYEIIIAFGDDIINKRKKSSALVSSDRLKLAISSFFEIIINYAIVYYLMGFTSDIYINILTFENMLDSLMKSIGISTLTNVGNLTVISTVQLFSSMCLIYFGLAGYISDNDKS